VVFDKIILEIKAVNAINDEFIAQSINYFVPLRKLTFSIKRGLKYNNIIMNMRLLFLNKLCNTSPLNPLSCEERGKYEEFKITSVLHVG